MNSKVDYKECLYFISNIKKEYEGVMHSFSIFKNNKEVFDKAYEIKNQIYSLDFGKYDNWKKDKLWEYINNDIDYIELWKFV